VEQIFLSSEVRNLLEFLGKASISNRKMNEHSVLEEVLIMKQVQMVAIRAKYLLNIKTR
jgi:uncharacterized protein YkvS